jgi:hypothetical protein
MIKFSSKYDLKPFITISTLNTQPKKDEKK